VVGVAVGIFPRVNTGIVGGIYRHPARSIAQQAAEFFGWKLESMHSETESGKRLYHQALLGNRQ
jgi:hypothetical protein